MKRRGSAFVLAFVVLVVVAVVGAVLVLRSEPPKPVQPRLGAGRSILVSRAKGPQSEVAAATDPTRPRFVLAGSNDIRALHMRVYASRDGGATWASSFLPLPQHADVCATSDPSVAIARDGREFYGYLGIHCASGRSSGGGSVYVASRRGHAGRWTALDTPVARATRYTLLDDRPSIAIDDARRRPRLYMAWTRFWFNPSVAWVDPDANDPDENDVNFLRASALVSYSEDLGRHWSRPAVLSRSGQPLEVRLAISVDGTIYATWRDAQSNSIFVAASSDGRTFGREQLVAAATVRPERSCHSSRARIPAQPKRCVSPNPVIAVDRSTGDRAGTVYVLWGSTSLNLSQDVYVAAFGADLRPRLGVGHVKQVNPEEGVRGPDQFLPTAAVDPKTGLLWACYYQTLGRAHVRARFTCTASDDGGKHWAVPVPATNVLSNEATRPANVANGYGDYEAVIASRGEALAFWTDGRGVTTRRREEIYAARVARRARDQR